MRHLATIGLVISVLPAIATARPADRTETAGNRVAVRYRDAVSPNKVRTLTVLPGEVVTFDVVDRELGSGYAAQSAGGQLVPQGTGSWRWTSPSAPGLYPIDVKAPDGNEAVRLQAFVVVPYERLQGEHLHGYRIGRYPEKPFRGLADYQLPAGFVEVTQENEDILVSPHFHCIQRVF